MQSNKKILCLGNNTEDTDILARKFSYNNNVDYHGLITNLIDMHPGCYQTSFYDIPYGDLIELITRVDALIILDQTKDSYPDAYGFYKTISIGKQFTEKVTFIDQSMAHTLEDVIKENKSLCILPFIQSVPINNKNHACCRSPKALSDFDPAIEYVNDEGRNQLKSKMLSGEKSPEHCAICYDLEDKNITSPRIIQTIEWANRLNITSLEELKSIDAPVYYEVRASNKCNLLCRSCGPNWSNLIDEENKKINFFISNDYTYNGYEHVNIENIQRLYISGGEPTISEELYQFLETCIAKGKTDFEIQINTNAVNLSTKFKSLIKHFTNVSFNVSVDGFEKVNQYVRWPTKWNKLVDNIDYLFDNHTISFNCVVSIYTINSLYDLINFISDRYKNSTYQITNAQFDNDILSPYNHPNREVILSTLTSIKQTELYKNNQTIKSQIDSYYQWYANNFAIDMTKLRLFFEYNDLLDRSRNVRLIDYIPELEACRNSLTKQI